MESAFAWVGRFAEWLGQFVPRWQIVDVTRKALKTQTVLLRDLLRCRWDTGAKISVHGPGLHFYWPLVTEFFTYSTAYQTMPLISQTIVTTDQRVIVASGVLAFEIEDLVKILAHTYDADDAIRDIAATSFHDVLCHQDWDALMKGQGRTLDTKLKNAAQRDLLDLGVKVRKFTLTSLAPARVLRLVTSSAVEGELTGTKDIPS